MVDRTFPNSNLIDLIYESASDPSLWPDLILELTALKEHLNKVQEHDAEYHNTVAEIVSHLKRSINISSKIVELEEQVDYLQNILNSLSYGVCLLSDDLRIIYANNTFNKVLSKYKGAKDSGSAHTSLKRLPKSFMEWADRGSIPHSNTSTLPDLYEGRKVDSLVTVADLDNVLMHPEASRMVITFDIQSSSVLRALVEKYGLTGSEASLISTLSKVGNLKRSAEQVGIKYETARVYMSNILSKVNCASQLELFQKILTCPDLVVHKKLGAAKSLDNVRNMASLSSDRRLEYFDIGNAAGPTVIFLGSFSGVTLDVLGQRTDCEQYLAIWGIRALLPCRPGCFRSDYFEHSNLTELATDYLELLDRLGVDEFAILSVGFSSGLALALAKLAGNRVLKVIMSSPTSPQFTPDTWKGIDPFSQVLFTLGSYSEVVFRSIVRFLVRSSIQNTDAFLDRYIKRCTSTYDKDILGVPLVRERTKELLRERTSNGLEGMVQEFYLDRFGWDFTLDDIYQPMEIYHGTDDSIAPLEVSRKLARSMKHAAHYELPQAGNFHHIVNWPWLIARASGFPVDINEVLYRPALPTNRLRKNL